MSLDVPDVHEFIKEKESEQRDLINRTIESIESIDPTSNISIESDKPLYPNIIKELEFHKYKVYQTYNHRSNMYNILLTQQSKNKSIWEHIIDLCFSINECMCFY